MSCFVNEKCGFVNSTVLSTTFGLQGLNASFTPFDEVVDCHPTMTPCFRASSFVPLRITTHIFSSL